MTYIIENANVLKEEHLMRASLLIRNEKILSVQKEHKRYSLIKMDADPFIMTPTAVFLNTSIPFEKPFNEVKKYYIDEFILKGCTAFLTMASIQYEYSMTTEIKRLKTHLLNSPIDYIIGVRIPVRLLTPSVIRKCKQEKVPAIFVEVRRMDELHDIPWGWIREAMFPYNSPLIPIFSSRNSKEKKQMKKVWKVIMKTQKIPSLKDELNENEPLPPSALTQIGIFPLKANLQQGCELTYNFYHKSKEIRNIEELMQFHYHSGRPVVTVHKGQVIRAGENTFFRPGFGEHVKINTPSYFKIAD